jgi:hypothetical protein
MFLYHSKSLILVVNIHLSMLPNFVFALNETNACLAHAECPVDFFCAKMFCTDRSGLQYICGQCRRCEACFCHNDAVDDRCPHDCHDQPTNGVRYLQGPFLARSAIPTIPTYTCLRRLTFDGGAFVDLQAPVSIEHPASAAPVDRTVLEAQCQPFARVGILLDFVPDPSMSGQTYQVSVVITSSGSSPFSQLHLGISQCR